MRLRLSPDLTSKLELFGDVLLLHDVATVMASKAQRLFVVHIKGGFYRFITV